jgi:hypothetical protein
MISVGHDSYLSSWDRDLECRLSNRAATNQPVKSAQANKLAKQSPDQMNNQHFAIFNGNDLH